APEQVVPTIVESVRGALKLPYVGVRSLPGSDPADAFESGTRPGECLRLPLTHAGETLGYLELGPRDPEEAWARADLDLLTSLALQAGAALHAVRLTAGLRQLTHDLQEARERLVVTREDERRRLRHDLHDELAPTLAAL